MSPCWPCETGSGASSQTVLRHPPAPCSRRPARSARHPGRRPSFARFDIRGARMGPKGQVWRALTQEVAPGGPAVCRIERNLAFRPPWTIRFMSKLAKLGFLGPRPLASRPPFRPSALPLASPPCAMCWVVPCGTRACRRAVGRDFPPPSLRCLVRCGPHHPGRAWEGRRHAKGRGPQGAWRCPGRSSRLESCPVRRRAGSPVSAVWNSAGLTCCALAGWSTIALIAKAAPRAPRN